MYTQEQYEQLPDWMQKDLVKDGDVYKHAGFVKVKQTADQMDGEKRAIAEQLKAYQDAEAERTAEAEKRAYEKARKEGNVDELERRFNQQLEDAERRRNESEKQFKDRMAKLAEKERRTLAVQIAAKYAVDADAAEILADLIERRIDVDIEQDSRCFKDAKGSALSVDQSGFEAEILKESRFARLLKGSVPTNGGGNANGSTNGSASVKNPFDKEHFNLSEQGRMMRENPTLAQQLKRQAEV